MRGAEAFLEHPLPVAPSPAPPALAAAPWSAAHEAGYAFYYPSGFSRAELTLRHHLLGIEFLPNVVGLRLDDGAYIETVVPTHSFYFVPAGSRVTISKEHACEYLLLTFDPDTRAGGTRLPAIMREQMMNAEFAERARGLRRQILLGSDGAAAGVRALATVALEALSGSAPPTQADPLISDWRLDAALAYVGDRFTAKLRVEEIAGVAGGLSPVRFSHLFSSTFALSVHQYVLRLRVHYARDRLLHGSDRIVDIAHDAGFCSQPHMTEVFRRCLGISPAHVRDGALAMS